MRAGCEEYHGGEGAGKLRTGITHEVQGSGFVGSWECRVHIIGNYPQVYEQLGDLALRCRTHPGVQDSALFLCFTSYFILLGVSFSKPTFMQLHPHHLHLCEHAAWPLPCR